jgi:predicted HAD superfamily Cof-like phosphohydrolase
MQSVKKFHDTFAPDQRNDDILDKIGRRQDLISEEYEEVIEALKDLERAELNLSSMSNEYCLEGVAKELADLLYVIYGTAEELGIPLEWVFKAVHKSNMSKVWPDGKIRYNEVGKILKPPTYSSPDLGFIHEHQFLPQST